LIIIKKQENFYFNKKTISYTKNEALTNWINTEKDDLITVLC